MESRGIFRRITWRKSQWWPERKRGNTKFECETVANGWILAPATFVVGHEVISVDLDYAEYAFVNKR